MTKDLKFYILAPPYRNNSMGVKVLHKLSDMINKVGDELGCAATTSSKIRRETKSSSVDCVRTFDDFYYNDADVLDSQQDRIILIAPDIDSTKHIKYRWRRVIKYALNYPFFFGCGDKKYDHDDLVMIWDERFNNNMFEQPDKANTVEFFISPSDIDTCFCINPEIKKNCDSFYVGKGVRDCHVDGVEINLYYPSNQIDLTHLLQRTKNFYCFDDNTAINLEALHCGCNVYIRSGGNWYPFNEQHKLYKNINKPTTDISILINKVREIL